MPTDTIPRRLFEHAKVRPEAPAYHVKRGGRWEATSYRAFAEEVKAAGKALMALGMPPRGTACILGSNRPEWVIFDVACMAIGAAPAGIYATCSPAEVQYVVHHAESPVVLVENAAQWRKVEAELGRLPLLRHVVVMRGAEPIDHPLVLPWEAFLARGASVADADFFARLDALEPSMLATLIYTSGTTGPPKGVMLSHENLAWTASVARDLAEGGPDDRTLSYLPLSHIAEQIFTIHSPLTMGASVYYCESMERLADDLKEARPTVFLGVPRVWEKFHAAISSKLAAAKGAKKRLADWAMRVGRDYHAARRMGGEASLALTVQHALADKLIYSKIKPALGLGEARVCVTGAAPIAREVLEFFGGLDLPICEVYGQSEGTGPTSFNRPGRTKLGTVGPPIPGDEVKIAEDGEILVRGPNVFLGYFKDPEATAEALEGGWLHSGDLGELDADGFLVITGRKKDIIITSGGKNVTPKNIESALKNHPLVSEAVVIGDRRKYLTALVTLDPEAAARLAAERGRAGVPPHELPEIRSEIQKAIDEVNATLARVETVKRFTVLPRSFSVETGELTPTLKVKRRAVAENFAEQIEAMYRE